MSATPIGLTVHNKSRILEVSFDDGATFSIPFELLRVYSPSAEVQGHGPGQEVLQVGKREVGIAALDPVGNYAVQPTFSDGHNTGLYTWDYLYKLGKEQGGLWRDYMERLHAAGFEGDTGRDPGAKLDHAPVHHGCGHQH
ncbi:gamma-butyrobetaine hydroxylase-like domain-containing protein [Oxalobacteraceae bacterium A2-2]